MGTCYKKNVKKKLEWHKQSCVSLTMAYVPAIYETQIQYLKTFHNVLTQYNRTKKTSLKVSIGMS